jgi:predicted enzyme related to lactoylglutathione lyase
MFTKSSLALSLALLVGAAAAPVAAHPRSGTPAVAVGPQYDTTHVYVAPEQFDRFVDSLIATFGGHTAKQGVFQVTPTPSQTMSQVVFTPVGTFSVFGFKTPIPYPFGLERTGYLVTDIDAAVKAARDNGADVPVAIFPDPIGKDAIVEWPGGVRMQLYWHIKAPDYPALATVPENRVYVSPERADALVRGFVAFSHGTVVSDVRDAAGTEIGRAGETFRRIRISSPFGGMTVLATDGHLPFPFGRELTGYEVSDLTATLARAKSAGATVLVPPFTSDGRSAALVQFPGGYIAEIHAPETR